MLKEKYNKYKLIYQKYIILIKNGNFYICINEDAFILNNIFNFKIIESKNIIKCGFPINSLNKIINTLNNLCINYLIVDSDIIDKEKYTNNNYNKYTLNTNYILLNRIDKINNILKLNINNNNINNILSSIESILCKIN